MKFNHDPNGALLAVGKDSKGRVQSVYSAAFSETQAAAKFSRIEELREKFDAIVDENNAARKSKSAATRDAADCMDMIMKMGIRPGSDTDTGAKVKAYGATTLEGKHVVQEGGDVYLRFVGKKGVNLDLKVPDPDLGRMLVERAKSAAADGKVFSGLSDKSLLAYTHSLDGGKFKTKDFRTHLGTSLAYGMVSASQAPKNEAEYKKAVMEVAKVVSSRLGNTPVIALQSYISPTVFSSWRIAT